MLFSSVFPLVVAAAAVLILFTGTCEGQEDFKLQFYRGPGFTNEIRTLRKMEEEKCIPLDEELRGAGVVRVNGGCVLIYKGLGCTDRRVSIRHSAGVNLKDKQLGAMSIKRETCTWVEDPDFRARLSLYADTDLRKLIAVKSGLDLNMCTPLAEWKQPILAVEALYGCFIVYEGYDCTGKQQRIKNYNGVVLEGGLKPESVRKISCKQL